MVSSNPRQVYCEECPLHHGCIAPTPAEQINLTSMLAAHPHMKNSDVSWSLFELLPSSNISTRVMKSACCPTSVRQGFGIQRQNSVRP
eukprot:2339660-Amphidinium_carterae.1